MNIRYTLIGIIFLISISYVSAYYCYQESANVSNQTGVDGNCGLNYSGVIGVSGYYFNVSYPKPHGALNTSLWTVKHGTLSAYNVSIPINCWDYNSDNLYLRFYAGSSYSYGECYDGVSWSTITSHSSGGTGFSADVYNHFEYLYDGDWSSGRGKDATAWRIVYGSASGNNQLVYEEAMYWWISDTVLYPLNYSQIINLTQNFTFNITLNTTDDYNNFTYNITCAVPANMSCNILNNITVNNFATIAVNINMSANISPGTYNGNLTFLRLEDHETSRISLVLGVASIYGVPQILNLTNYLITMYDNQVQSLYFNLSNTGSANITNCTHSLSGGFLGFGFYSSKVANTIVPGSSALFNLTFTNPSAGSYSGYLNIECTTNNLTNSLALNNRPIIALSALQYIAPSGGGGSQVTIITNLNDSFEITPRVLDTIYLITTLGNNVWNYTIITNRIVTACTIDNGFTCKVQDNKVILFKDYEGKNILTSYDSAVLTVTSGTEAITDLVSVRVLNILYYIPFEGLPNIPFLVYYDNGSKGVIVLSLVLTLLIGGFIYARV